MNRRANDCICIVAFAFLLFLDDFAKLVSATQPTTSLSHWNSSSRLKGKRLFFHERFTKRRSRTTFVAVWAEIYARFCVWARHQLNSPPQPDSRRTQADRLRWQRSGPRGARGRFQSTPRRGAGLRPWREDFLKTRKTSKNIKVTTIKMSQYHYFEKLFFCHTNMFRVFAPGYDAPRWEEIS